MDERGSKERRTSGERRIGARSPEAPLSTELRWTVGCLIASMSMVGVLILVGLVAIALSPPTWVQVVLGVGLVLGGAVFAWLIATALGQRRAR
jgi:hypothetical protein